MTVPLANETIDIWVARLGDAAVLGVPNETVGTFLSPEEREQRSRLRFANDRNLFTLAHGLLRIALSRYANAAPHVWAFERGAHGKKGVYGKPLHGKPRLRDDLMQMHGLHFSLSHAGMAVACAITRAGEVGVDIEPLDSSVDPDDLAASVLSPEERRALSMLEASEKRRRFLTLWTLKEAYGKARGFGLSFPLADCTFRFDPLRIAFADHIADSPGLWSFDTRLLGGNAVISAALLGSPGQGGRFRYRYSRDCQSILSSSRSAQLNASCGKT